MQTNKIVFEDIIDSNVSEYYDDEMPEAFMMNYEARMAQSEIVKNYTYDNCFEFFKISNSIKLTKNRLKDKSENITKEILLTIEKKNPILQFLSRFL